MKKEVWYLAHPVSGDPRGNAEKAIAWIKWLTINHQERIYVAPWVAEVLAFADQPFDQAFYDRLLADDCDIVRRLDGVLLVGTHVSRGMQLELDAAVEAGKPAINLTSWWDAPPKIGTPVSSD